ncbi:hypothetical protein Dda_7476 [Drechslerella dactyloides]|uniref:Uncharacterized protein n=1 Tax=Drechslerella dactyloides TaxID=74499 RepID=A0AAD6IS78_DREDA|nr:hypothetical protein Dda_7476 [Drechslerella dactyloides]
MPPPSTSYYQNSVRLANKARVRFDGTWEMQMIHAMTWSSKAFLRQKFNHVCTVAKYRAWY